MLDRKALSTIFVSLSGGITTTYAILLGMTQSQLSLPGTVDACTLSAQEIVLIKGAMMGRANSSCLFNMTVSSVLGL